MTHPIFPLLCRADSAPLDPDLHGDPQAALSPRQPLVAVLTARVAGFGCGGAGFAVLADAGVAGSLRSPGPRRGSPDGVIGATGAPR